MSCSTTRRPEYRTVVALFLCLTGIEVLQGCAIHPSTGRSQLIIVPDAQIAHADMGFALLTASNGSAASVQCLPSEPGFTRAGGPGTPCPSASESEKFRQQVERIGAELGVAAGTMAPDLLTRIKPFRIEVVTGMEGGTTSSAGGRILIAADFAALDPTDDVVAFLIAREMGRVIARHGEEDSGARMAFSAITALIPGGALIVKLATAILGSRMLTSTWAPAQRREADELALLLLAHCGRPAGAIALNLRAGFRREHLPGGEWGEHFAQSRERVFAIARAGLPAGQIAAVQ